MLFSVASGTAGALDSSKAISQFGHDVWQDELPQNTIHCILQARNGYLWLGTYEGLIRFDGVRFVLYDTRPPANLRGTAVLALAEDRSGTLWIATNGGLSRFENGRFSTTGTAEGLPSNVVFSLCEGKDGSLWVGTDRGVARKWHGAFTVFTTANGLANDSVRSIVEGEPGVFWFATDDGLSRLRDGRFTTWRAGDGLPASLLRLLVRGEEGEIWIGGYGGLTRLRDGTFRTFTTADGLPENFVRALYRDRGGSLWVGTENGGLSRFRDGRFVSFSTRDGLSHDYVRSVFEDREGSLWVGTNGGLDRFRDSNFTTFSRSEGLSHNFARTVLEDSTGTIWIGTDGGGLSRLSNGSIRNFGVADGLPNDSVRALVEDRDGTIWVGTRGGLARVSRGETFRLLPAPEGLPSNLVRALVVDRTGIVWVGTEGGGLAGWDGARFRVLSRKDGLPHDDIRALHEDQAGNLWVATRGGIARLGGLASGSPRVRTYSRRDGLANDIVFSFLEEPDGTLWVGTDGGLSRISGERIVSLSTDDGLCDNKVFRILDDGRGSFWTSSNRGVCQLDAASLRKVADSGRGKVVSRLYNKADGMPANQCNGASQPAGWKDRQGRLWFPTVHGVVRIDPGDLHRNQLVPPVIVEEALVDGSAVDLRSNPRVRPGPGKFEFRYTALSLLAPSRVAFRFRLFGLEDRWTDAGGRRTAYYNNVPPGRYEFRVQGSNNDGVWNEVGDRVSFELLAPWWKSRWAWMLYLVATVTFVLGGVRWRTAALRRYNVLLEERVRERTAALDRKTEELDRKNEELAEKIVRLEISERLAMESDARSREANHAKSVFLSSMSHELRTPLNSIIGFSQILLGRLDGKIEGRFLTFLTNIEGSGRHLLGLINDILDLAKVESGKMELEVARVSPVAIIEDVRGIMRGITEARRIEIDVFAESNLIEVDADPQRLREILFNLVSNAVKFSPDGLPVSVRISRVAAGEPPLLVEAVRIDVRDQGIGIAAKDHALIFEEFQQAETGPARRFGGTGLGLTLVRRLVELHGGRITLDSEPGKGSVFTVFLPRVWVPRTGEDLKVARGGSPE
jgi:signal transduction histidine kinase/ligand-binding sensor domain-containing protein